MVWWIVASVVAATAGLLIRARMETGSLSVTEVTVPVPELPEGLDGLSIVHLSDLHLSGYGPFERKLVSTVRQLPGAVVALTGDYLAGPGGATALIPVLMEIGRDRPVLGVLGNCDHRPPVNAQALVNDLSRSGVRVLVNDGAVVRLPGGRLRVAGIDDPHTGRDDLEAALGSLPPNRGPEREPVVLLAHSPDAFPTAVKAGVDLVLAGHTHGGQICLPGGVALWTNSRLGRRFSAGLFRQGKTHMYVSRGIGTGRWPLRLFCPPEATVIRLVRAPADEARATDQPGQPPAE
ncbi:MAG: metallophosphoesterase [Firmicutes bacterium]|nr:metallophosphoesterase [Bacillota bacterium]